MNLTARILFSFPIFANEKKKRKKKKKKEKKSPSLDISMQRLSSSFDYRNRSEIGPQLLIPAAGDKSSTVKKKKKE